MKHGSLDCRIKPTRIYDRRLHRKGDSSWLPKMSVWRLTWLNTPEKKKVRRGESLLESSEFWLVIISLILTTFTTKLLSKNYLQKHDKEVPKTNEHRMICESFVTVAVRRRSANVMRLEDCHVWEKSAVRLCFYLKWLLSCRNWAWVWMIWRLVTLVSDITRISHIRFGLITSYVSVSMAVLNKLVYIPLNALDRTVCLPPTHF